jgi:hypothetical protein
MNRRNWRETVEIVGIVSIVASLLLVAWEIHRANRIAAASLEVQLQLSFAELQGARAITPDFARLFPKLGSPEGHLITATEASQIKGLAMSMVEVYRAAQVAHDHGLLDDARLANYTSRLATMLETYPGLARYLAALHDADPEIRTMPVFRPVRDRDARRAPVGND